MTGAELRKQRKNLGLTQVQLADRLGVSGNAVARWERGERRISQPVALLIELLIQSKKTRLVPFEEKV